MPAPFAAGAALLSKELGKRLLRKKLLEAGATGTAAVGLGVGAAGVGEMLANKPKKREESRMGSDKNIDKERIGKGGFEAPSVKKVSDKSKNRPSTVKDSMDIPVSPMMPTAGIAGLAGGPSGAAAERMPEMGRETYFGPSQETVMPAPRMRRGLFGEEIPEDEYLEMERKNKEAGFYGRFKKGGSVKKKTKNYASGGSVSGASKRADGCCQKGKTKGRVV
jgi:hypothetical protein